MPKSELATTNGTALFVLSQMRGVKMHEMRRKCAEYGPILLKGTPERRLERMKRRISSVIESDDCEENNDVEQPVTKRRRLNKAWKYTKQTNF